MLKLSQAWPEFGNGHTAMPWQLAVVPQKLNNGPTLSVDGAMASATLLVDGATASATLSAGCNIVSRWDNIVGRWGSGFGNVVSWLQRC